MKGQMNSAVDIALIHYPVIGKVGEIIGSAITNLDLHDIARAAKTFGVERYYLVTPYADQQDLVREIMAHWQSGYGADYNPARKSAFDLVRVAVSLDEVVERITARRNCRPVLVTTSANIQENGVSFVSARERIESGEATLLLFGTAHGLAPEITAKADYTLPPITGRSGYNHLAVRSAVSIICDRLLGVHN